VWPGAYPRVEHLKIALALPTNIRQARRGLPGTNTLAYCKNLEIAAVNFFSIYPWLFWLKTMKQLFEMYHAAETN
jgi:hypothetical protein